MGVAETVYEAVAVMVAAAAIPTAVNARIGRQLHQAKRHRSPRVGVAMTARAYEGVDVAGEVGGRDIFRALGQADAGAKKKRY